MNAQAKFGDTASDTLRALHREVDQEFADEGGIAPLDDDINIAQRHRHGEAWDGPVPLSLQDARAIYRRLAWSVVALVVLVWAVGKVLG